MQLIKYFHELSLHPKNAKELKGLILQLAVQGKLTRDFRASHPELRKGSHSASALLEQIKAEKTRLVKEKKIKKENPLPPISKDEIPYELPEGWIWCRLGEHGYTQTGSTPPMKHQEYYGKYIPFLGPADISNSWMKYPEDGLSEIGISKGRLIQKESLLMVCIGGSIGKCNINEVNVSCNQQLNIITPLVIPVGLVKYVCQSPYFQKEVLNKATGSATPIINKGKWEKIPVPLPPLSEQKAIVETVNQLFKEVEQLEQLTVERIQLKEQFATSALNQLATNNTIKEWAFLQEHFHSFFNHQPNIKKLRETILQLAVQGKLTTHFRLGHPELREGSHSAAALLEQIKAEKARLVKEKIIKKENPLPAINKDAIPFEIPENWVWCSLGDIGSTNIGLTYSPNDISDKGIPVLRSSNVQNGEITLQDLVRVNKDVNENAKVQNGDILICARNGSKRLVGKCAIISDLSEETAFGAFMAIFRSNCNPYIKYFIESPVYRRSLEGVSTTTINQITQSNLKETLIPLPPLSEQKAIVETVNRLMALCDQLEKVIQQSEKQVELVMKGVLREVLG